MSTMRARMKVMPLATIIGRELILIPYRNQLKTPIIKMRYMNKLMSLVDLVFNVCITCGINANVVQNAAKYPRIKTVFIFFSFKTFFYIFIFFYVASILYMHSVFKPCFCFAFMRKDGGE